MLLFIWKNGALHILIRHIYTYTLLFALAFLMSLHAHAQPKGNDTLLLGAVIVGADTIPMVYMHDIEVFGKLSRKQARKWKRSRARYDRLKHNVYKVYPYAVIAADVLKDVDSNLLAIGEDKKKRKEYLKSVELELRSRFKGELEDMTVTQGHVLVKLIDRQTGKNCYNIIRELKGGFSAVVIQSVAVLFTHNLKREYDPYGEDKDMEKIVRDLEATRSYEYEYHLQQSRLKKEKG